MICKHCQQPSTSYNSLRQHEVRCQSNPNRKLQWNIGLSKSSHPSIANAAQKLTGKKRPDISGSNNTFYQKRFGSALTGHSDSTKKKLSSIAKGRNLGGYVKGSGRGKKGWYKGIFCDSSLELALVIFCLGHNKQIIRNTEMRQYIWNNKRKNYLPDFVIDGQLVEVKGYKSQEWMAKINANPDVKVLYESEMKPILDYVVDKYGKDFIILYE